MAIEMNILLTIHLIVTLFLVMIVLVQKSSEDGLGISSGANAMMSSRGAANFFTRTTAILATLFISNAIIITIVTKSQLSESSSLLTPSQEPISKTSKEEKSTL